MICLSYLRTTTLKKLEEVELSLAVMTPQAPPQPTRPKMQGKLRL
jgi:hypothetical protein